MEKQKTGNIVIYNSWYCVFLGEQQITVSNGNKVLCLMLRYKERGIPLVKIYVPVEKAYTITCS